VKALLCESHRHHLETACLFRIPDWLIQRLGLDTVLKIRAEARPSGAGRGEFGGQLVDPIFCDWCQGPDEFDGL